MQCLRLHEASKLAGSTVRYERGAEMSIYQSLKFTTNVKAMQRSLFTKEL